jgi:hypothetical protein
MGVARLTAFLRPFRRTFRQRGVVVMTVVVGVIVRVRRAIQMLMGAAVDMPIIVDAAVGMLMRGVRVYLISVFEASA